LITIFRKKLYDNESPPSPSPQDQNDDQPQPLFTDIEISTTTLAVHCAHRIHHFCSKTNHLSAHVAIEYGEINFSIIGGYRNQWVYLLTGKCIDSIGSCLDEANANQTVISEAAYFHLSDQITDVEKLSSGRYLIPPPNPTSRSKSIFHTFSFPLPLPSISISSPTQSSAQGKMTNGSSTLADEIQCSLNIFKNLIGKKQLPLPLSAEPPTMGSGPTSPIVESQSVSLASHIVSFLPRTVLEGISLGLLDQLSELRTVTTLFLKVENSNFTDHVEPTLLHQFFYTMQECLADGGGYLRQFLFDDKGCVLIALWGVPTATYANNCSRALRCAVVMSHQAKQLGYLLSIGISTGSVYCGTIGLSNIRQDYVAIGKSVNLSARLMSQAHGKILLDEKTFEYLPLEISTLYVSTLSSSLTLKGFTEPLNIFWYSSNNLPPFVIRDTPADSSLVFEKYILKHLQTVYSYLSLSLRPVVCSRESMSGDRVLYSYLEGGDEGTVTGGEILHQRSFETEFIPSKMTNLLFGKRPYFFAIYGSPGEHLHPTHPFIPFTFASHDLDSASSLTGIGKTAIATYLSRKYKCMGCNVTFVRASSSDESIDFNILKKILIGLISLINENTFTNDLQTQKDVLISILKKAFPTEDLSSIAQNRFPSLQKILRLSWDMSSLPSSSSTLSSLRSSIGSCDQGRMNTKPDSHLTISTIIRAIIGIIQGNGSSGNVLIIDNAHYMCSMTWSEITKLVTLHCPLLIILTFRIHEAQNKLFSSGSRHGDGGGTDTSSGAEMNVNTVTRIGRSASNFILSTLQRRYEAAQGDKQNTSHGGLEIARHYTDYISLLSKLSPLNSSSLVLKPLNHQSVKKIISKVISSIDYTSRAEMSSYDPLVKSVYNLSHGIPYWIWKIIKFMKSSHDPILNFHYKSFICYLLDKFTETEKNIIKCASVIGVEFHVDVLRSMIAPFLVPELEEILLSLVDGGLINLINAKLFIFRSSILREYIYSLIPPRSVGYLLVDNLLISSLSDAASLHLLAADTIEIIHGHDLTLFTPLSVPFNHFSSHPLLSLLIQTQLSLFSVSRKSKSFQSLAFYSSCCHFMFEFEPFP
jgi:class 3 adenylate cyclase